MHVINQEIYHQLKDKEFFHYVDDITGEIYRQLESRKTLRFVMGNEAYFIKLHYGSNFFDFLKNLIRFQWPILGAKREWLAIQQCQRAGVQTLNVVAFAQQKGILHQRSFLMTKALDNSMSLEDLMLLCRKNQVSFKQKMSVTAAVAGIMRRMHAHGIAHRDCYLCHFLMDKSFLHANRCLADISIIDLHRAIQFNVIPRRWRIKDLSQLYFSAMSFFLNKRFFLRFMCLYLQMSPRELLAEQHGLLHAIHDKALSLYRKYHRKFSTYALKTTNGRPLLLKRKQLLSANPNSTFSFALQLANDSECLLSDTIIRSRKGRRLVIDGWYRNRPVIAKVYYHAIKSHIHWQREVKGLSLLAHSGTQTPRCYYAGKLAAPSHVYVLILEKIHDVLPLTALKQPAFSQLFLMRQMECLAKCHQKGILQNDCHPGNYLLTKQDLYAIDGADISHHEELSQVQRLQQIAEIFVQMRPQNQETWNNAYEAYVKTYGHSFRNDNDVLDNCTQLAEKMRIARLMRRTRRNCSDFYCTRQWTLHFLLSKKYCIDNYTCLFSNPDNWFHQNATTIKQGRTATVIRAELGKKAIIIKRYNMKSSWHRLKRAFQKTRAANAWYYSHLLTYFMIPTAEPVALYERCIGPIKGTAYFVMKFVDGQSLNDYLQHANQIQMQSICDQMVRILLRLKQLRIVHGDLKASNFVVAKHQLYILDLDSMSSYRVVRILERDTTRDIQRLLSNWASDTTFYQLLVRTLATVF